jgi:hypothetical protein
LQPFNQLIVFVFFRWAVLHVIDHVCLRINFSVLCSPLNFIITDLKEQNSIEGRWLDLI